MSESPLLSIPNDEVLFQKHQLLPFTVANLHYQFISEKCGTVFLIFINIISSLTNLTSIIFFKDDHFCSKSYSLCTLKAVFLPLYQVTGLFSWLILSRTLCNNVVTMLEVSSILTDQKLVVQFDSKLTWEMKLLISHGILYLNDYQTTESCWFARLRFMEKNVSPLLWWRFYKLSSHFIIDKQNFSSVTVCVEWRSVTQWFPAPKRQLWRKKSIVSHLGFIINLHHLDSCIIDFLMRTNSNWNGQRKWVKQTQ